MTNGCNQVCSAPFLKTVFNLHSFQSTDPPKYNHPRARDTHPEILKASIQYPVVAQFIL